MCAASGLRLPFRHIDVAEGILIVLFDARNEFRDRRHLWVSGKKS
jgi:hypothetical protein